MRLYATRSTCRNCAVSNTLATLPFMAGYPCEYPTCQARRSTLLARSTLLGRLWAQPGTLRDPLGEPHLGTLLSRRRLGPGLIGCTGRPARFKPQTFVFADKFGLILLQICQLEFHGFDQGD